MRFHRLPLNRIGLLVLLLLALHLGALRYVVMYGGLSVGVAVGVAVLIVVKHLGLFGSLSGLVRRRSRL